MEDLSKAIQGLAAAVVSVAIAASVAYETGYFSIIGQKYQGILSASDYLSSALEWLPWLSLLYGVGLLLAHIGSFQLTQMAGQTFKARPLVLAGLIICLIAAVCLLAALVPFYKILLYLPIAALPAVAAPLFGRLWKTASSIPKLTAIAVSSIAVMLALYCSGVGRAHRDISFIDNAYVIRPGIDIEGAHVEGAQVLRALQKGLLVWKPQESRVDLVGWEKVERMTHLIWKSYDAPWFEPLGCNIWNKLCQRQPPPLP